MDWLRYKIIYFSLSTLLIVVSAFGLLRWGLKLGVDFHGGTIVEYKSDSEISTEHATGVLGGVGIETRSIQKTDNGTYIFRLQSIKQEDKDALAESVGEIFGPGEYEEVRYETVGPAIGPELIKKTIYAISIASIFILLWVAYQFKSLKFGGAAILAMLHDSFILIGSFSLLGNLYSAEVDFLFVTALLTTLSFSVHDTIVVFDRIRELQRNVGGELADISNQALTETMVRSLNNSFTIIFMLLALILMGGVTTKWFAAALMIGTVLGTYSSPFVAVPLLNFFDKFKRR